jgi:hypothetical protein
VNAEAPFTLLTSSLVTAPPDSGEQRLELTAVKSWPGVICPLRATFLNEHLGKAAGSALGCDGSALLRRLQDRDGGGVQQQQQGEEPPQQPPMDWDVLGLWVAATSGQLNAAAQPWTPQNRWAAASNVAISTAAAGQAAPLTVGQ